MFIRSSMCTMRALACVCACLIGTAALATPHAHKFDQDLRDQRATGLADRITVMVMLQSDQQLSSSGKLAQRNAAVGATRARALSVLPANSFVIKAQWSSVAGMVLEIDSAQLDALAASPDVIAIGTNLGAGSGNLNESVPLVGLDEVVSQFGYTGANTRVAVLDSGYDTNHPDLADSLIGQKCFAEGGAACPNGADNAEDDFGHGTWVSGVITGNGGAAPVGGAPATQIYAVKVLDSNNSFSSTAFVVDGLDFVINSGIDFDAVNMSLGTNASFAGDCDSAAAFTMVLADAVNTLRANGTVSVVSTGNAANTNAMQAPACVAGAISVGASHDGGPQNSPPCPTQTVDTATCYSNASATTDVFAPGSEILTTSPNGVSRSVHGTSFSAPLVSACVAAMRNAVPDLTPNEIEAALENTASVTISAGGRNFPRMDCLAAVNSIRPGVLEEWHLDGVLFDDGGTATGSFLFDASRNRYSNIDISTFAPDGTLVQTYSDRLPVSPGNANILIAVPDDSVADVTDSPVIAINWSTALSDVAGTRDVALPGPAFQGEGTCLSSGCSASFPRRFVRGRTVSADDYVNRVKWYLDDVLFTDGTAATGSFSFDTEPQTYFEPEITTRAGAAAGAEYRDIWPVFAGNNRALRLVPNGSLADLTDSPLLFIDWLTDAHAGGGTTNIDVDGFSEENVICAPDGNCWFATRLITSGRAVAPLLDVKRCNNPGLAIPDNDANGVSNDLLMQFDGAIVDFNVGLFIAHTFVGDLTISIEHVETGTTVLLADRPGAPAINQFGCGSDDADILVDDEGSAALEDTCEPVPPALIGDLTPTQPLSALDGENLGGTWRLNVSDGESSDLGTLIEWCVDATVVSGPEGRDIDSDGVVDAMDNCILVDNNQFDGDGDGFGNACDTDINNDCTTNVIDLGLLRSLFFTTPASANWNPAADFNNDNIVNVIDLGLLRAGFFGRPGPSGIGNQCE